jgi:Uncharacterized protein conserved in bacteria
VNGDDHPMAWYHDYDGGRAFYTNMGHTKESFSDELYLKHILGAFNMQSAIMRNWIIQKPKHKFHPTITVLQKHNWYREYFTNQQK